MQPADLILTSARVWDGTHRDAEAIAVADGRVVASGSNSEVLNLGGDGTRTIDVGGRRVIPGLIDSHLHLVRGGRTWDREVRWDDLDTLDDALDSLGKKAEDVGPGRWVGVMGGWHPNQFKDARRSPSLVELDDAAPDNPVFTQRAYAETFVNSRAIAEMGWTDDDAPGGRVTSPQAMGELRARLAVTDIEEAMSATRRLLRELNGYGLTGAIDASGFGITAESYDAFLGLFSGDERGFRARFLLGASTPGAEMADIARWTDSVSLDDGDDFVRYFGAGEVLDYAAHDMEGLAPKDISDRVGAIRDVSAHLAEKRWPVHLHSILDSSVGVLLDAWESIADADLAALRWAICHADQIGEKNLARVADLGVGITIQNGMSMRGVDCDPTWGTDAVTQSPPIKTMLDLGIPVAAGTDGTVACAYNPWRCIAWLVTGESIDGTPPRAEFERLDIDEALRLYTSAGAWFSFEEDTRGTLRDGAHADLAVLSDDPLSVSPQRLDSIESVLTVVGGLVVHENLESATLGT